MKTSVQTPVTATSELNNLLQIIGGTAELLENIWEGTPGSERYLQMLRTSVARAAAITAEIVEKAGGVSGRIIVAARIEAPAEAAAVERRRPRILVVDDEPMALRLSEEFLTSAGYEVVTAESGFEALDLFVRALRPFDLAILDLTMPFMDGEETFYKLRGLDPNLRVILTTGFIHEQRLEKLLAAGLSGFMRKPLPPDEMLAHVAAVLTPSGNDAASSVAGTAAA